jgi:hypothetical protein
MAKRIWLAGLLGGIALFMWGSFSHLVLGLGNVGIQEIPAGREESVQAILREALPQGGFYAFPGMGISKTATAEEKAAATRLFQQKYRQGPYGLLIFHPEGAEVLTPGQLGIQLGLTILEALIAAWLLSLATGLHSFGARAGFIFVLGVLMALSTNIEYWNWYGFPASYTAAYMLDKVVGFLIVGLVVAALVKKRAIAPVLQASRAA